MISHPTCPRHRSRIYPPLSGRPFRCGRWLARIVFRLDPNAIHPSAEIKADQDSVPTERGIVFAHHVTSIAGTPSIVSPGLAILWGWGPAMLRVLFGSILIGAVHDFSTLFVSLRWPRVKRVLEAGLPPLPPEIGKTGKSDGGRSCREQSAMDP